MTGVRLELLGGFRLMSSSGVEVDVRAKKNRALLAILALAPRLEVTRDHLIGLLWSDRADEQARSSLRQALVSLRKDFAALEAEPIALNGDRVRLDPKRMSVDVVEFLASSAGDDGSALRAAAALYVGPFLDGFATNDNALEDWLRDARADLAGRAARVFGSLAGTIAGAERIAVAERLVALEPLREASHLTLMQAHIAEGQPALAIKHYEICRLLLKRELGVEPSEDLQKLRRTLDRSSNEPPGAVSLGRKPVIAVLPFENLSGHPGQQFFSDGISEDIIDRLTKYRVLSVIGHHSSFAMRARGTDLREIREKLKADYVLTGNVRRSENRIRIAARLTDAKTEGAVWADHYDRALADIFALQDDVASIIASTLIGRVEIDIATRNRTATPASISSYEYVLQGMWHFRKLSPITDTLAVQCFKKAIDIYPENAEAHKWLASCHNNTWFFELSRQGLLDSLVHAGRAMELDPTSASCFAVYGFSQLWLDGINAAGPYYQKALSLNPGDPGVLIELGLLNVYSGNLSVAHEFFDQAFRLNPLPPLWYAEFRGVAEFVQGRYAEALPAFAAVPSGAWDAMYELACLGHLEDHRRIHLLRSRHSAALHKWNLLEGAKAEPFRDPEPRERLIAGIRKGLDF